MIRLTLVTLCALLLTAGASILEAGKPSCCAPQPTCCSPATKATAGFRYPLPYHIALQRAEDANKAEALNTELAAKLEKLEAQLASTQKIIERNSKQTGIESKIFEIDSGNSCEGRNRTERSS